MKVVLSIFIIALGLAALVAFTQSGGATRSVLQTPDSTVVTVNGAPISDRQLVAAIDAQINAHAARDAAKGLEFEESSRDSTRAFMRDNVLRMLIERRLTNDELIAEHLDISDAEVDARFLTTVNDKKQTLTEAQQEIRQEGETLVGVKENLRQNMSIERLFAAHATVKAEMSDVEAEQFYNDNPHHFEYPELRRVSRILCSVPLGAGIQVKAAAKARAENLLIAIKAGKDFATVAQESSDDTDTKSKGGDRGWSPRGWVSSPSSDPFGNVAFAMKNIGDMSDVVETQDGYDIIKLTGLKPAGKKTYEEAKSKIVAEERYRRIGAFWNQFGNDLWKKANVVYSPEEIGRQVAKAKQEKEFEDSMAKQNTPSTQHS